jgi:hypothetical protein
MAKWRFPLNKALYRKRLDAGLEENIYSIDLKKYIN